MRSLRSMEPAQQFAHIELFFAGLHAVIANVRQVTVATFYLFGFVLFWNLQTNYCTYPARTNNSQVAVISVLLDEGYARPRNPTVIPTAITPPTTSHEEGNDRAIISNKSPSSVFQSEVPWYPLWAWRRAATQTPNQMTRTAIPMVFLTI